MKNLITHTWGKIQEDKYNAYFKICLVISGNKWLFCDYDCNWKINKFTFILSMIYESFLFAGPKKVF